MRAVLQRVFDAQLSVGSEQLASIGPGIVLYVCFYPHDGDREIEWLAKKIEQLRIFNDENGRFARNLHDCKGSALLVPNFTLAAKVGKGTRPSFSSGIAYEEAKLLFDKLLQRCKKNMDTQAGVFGAEMRITATAAGPVNLIIEVPPQKN